MKSSIIHRISPKILAAGCVSSTLGSPFQAQFSFCGSLRPQSAARPAFSMVCGPTGAGMSRGVAIGQGHPLLWARAVTQGPLRLSKGGSPPCTHAPSEPAG